MARGSPAHEPEISHIEWDLDLGERVEHAVESRGRHQLERPLAVPAIADAVDHVIALPPFLDHLRDHFRRILKVRIDHDDAIPARVIHACCDRRLMTEIS